MSCGAHLAGIFLYSLLGSMYEGWACIFLYSFSKEHHTRLGIQMNLSLP
jgi:hypothetical protein